MSKVEFEEPIISYSPNIQHSKEGLAGYMISLGLVKNEPQAKLVMVVIIICCLAIMAYAIFSSGGSGSDSKRVPAEEVNRIMNLR